MARHTHLFPMLLALALLPACGERTSTGEAVALQDSAEVAAPKEGGLALDNGRKWTVSPHMMVPIRRMRERMAAVEPKELDAPHALADSLFMDMDELVRTCDMKGPAHDMLHEWLMPHMTLLQRLETAPNADSARTVLDAMERSNTLFDQYFE